VAVGNCFHDGAVDFRPALQVGLQGLAQVAAGPRKQGLDRLRRHAHHFADLRVTEMFELGQEHGHPLSVVQHAHRLLDGGTQLGLVELARGHESAGGDRGRLERDGAARVGAGREVDLAPPGQRAERVGGHVAGDREQPGGKFGARRVAFPRPIHAQEHFLRQIVGQVPLPRVVHQERQNTMLVAEHQLFERLRVVIAHLQHQPHIGVGQRVPLGSRLANRQR
jgi:hypothetical protein